MYYPTSDQNRLNTGKAIQTKDTFDYTQEQRRKAENFIILHMFRVKKEKENAIKDWPNDEPPGLTNFLETSIRHLVERQVGSQDFQTKLQSLFFELVGL
jgi:hypothetical protein